MAVNVVVRHILRVPTSSSGAYALIGLVFALMISGSIIKAARYLAAAGTRAAVYVEKRAEDAVLADIQGDDAEGEFNEFGEDENDSESKVDGRGSKRGSSLAGDGGISPENQLLMALRKSQGGASGTAGRIQYLDGSAESPLHYGPKITSPVAGGKLFKQSSPMGLPSGASPYSYMSPQGPSASLTMQTPGTMGSTFGQTGPPTLPEGPPVMLGAMGATTGGMQMQPGGVSPYASRLAPLHSPDINGGPPIKLMSQTMGAHMPGGHSPYNAYAPRGGGYNSTGGMDSSPEGPPSMSRPVRRRCAARAPSLRSWALCQATVLLLPTSPKHPAQATVQTPSYPHSTWSA